MSATQRKQYFMQHEQMDFETQILLGGCYYGAADAGEILSTIGRIPSGDFEQWYREWHALAERIQKIAEGCAAAGHPVSARKAFLRAAGYFSASAIFIDGTEDPSRGVPAWKRHLDCWEQFCAGLSPPAEKVYIPYEGASLPGYFFRPNSSGGRRATIIFNNGSDGATSAMWQFGVAAALERGYAALVFDGPGQNAMLWLHGIPFRHDWEKVIAPVVDFLEERLDVDPRRIALSGLSQGGYWILRALAFEHRIAAGIADPGVMDVFTPFFRYMPPEMIELLNAGREKDFNEAMDTGLEEESADLRQNLLWRMKPYGVQSYYQLYKAVRQYSVRDVIGRIQCPMFVADPEDEQFWPGQSAEVYNALTCPKTIASFTAAEGANWHCEPKARSLYDQRMFDWLAGVMPA
ncbi:alpha/beta hydrolase family protein [Microbulbifer sp.]|uniref:alpha/beta hydrolase family protein n=1 Tax=Microbulbifer sp. TaxID=1908541 RepID=UPI003F3FF670